MRKFFEKIVEGGLLISGGVTSFTILLIVFFLFKEASGLFNSPVVEEGYVLAVNKSNDVSHLSPETIMDIFDAKITNWKEVNGKDEEILVFRFSDLTQYYSEEEFPIKSANSSTKSRESSHSFLSNIWQKTSGEPFFPKRKYRFPTSSPAPNGTRPLHLLLSSG